MTIDRVGVIVMKEPPGAHPSGSGHDVVTATIKASADGELLVYPGAGCLQWTAVYHWEIVDTFLRLEIVADNCPPRAHVLPGDWSR